MSEPVGNSPRNSGDIPDIPGNSHNQRREASVQPPKPEETKEAVAKIVVGKVVTRKQPWYKRLGRNLVADDAQSIGDFLISDVVAPALRNLVHDTIVGGTDRVIYGQSRARRGGSIGESRSLRTRYDHMSSDRGEPRRMMSRESRARHDFDDVVLDDRAEAIEVVEALIRRVDQYRAASVSDLYDLVGVTGSYADRSWGWTDLSTADIRQYRGGWLLDLPRPEPLR